MFCIQCSIWIKYNLLKNFQYSPDLLRTHDCNNCRGTLLLPPWLRWLWNNFEYQRNIFPVFTSTTHLWLCEVWPRGWASGNSVMGAPILMYFSDILHSLMTSKPTNHKPGFPAISQSQLSILWHQPIRDSISWKYFWWLFSGCCGSKRGSNITKLYSRKFLEQRKLCLQNKGKMKTCNSFANLHNFQNSPFWVT